MALVAIDSRHPDPSLLEMAASILRRGGLVAFPTETVYGLGADALSALAVEGIFAAKGRPAYNPLIVHVADAAAAQALVTAWPAEAEALAAAFWPGPLTLVLPKQGHVPDAVTAGLPAVGVRVPAHPVALALLQAFGGPIAAPSANRFTELSPTSGRHVQRSLGDRVAMILDGGPTAVGIESTVLDLTGAQPRVLRPGMVSAEAIAAVIGPVATTAGDATEGEARLSPGMMERHYAPAALLRLVDVHDPSAVAAARQQAEATRTTGSVVGLLTFGGLTLSADVAVQLPLDPVQCAQRLYATLHDLDAEGCALVVMEHPPQTPDWLAVHDRLRRAATA